MLRGLRRMLLICVCVISLFAIFSFGASAYTTYTYPKMPADWQNVQVTIGNVTLPLARYPAGSYLPDGETTMSVAEQLEYGFNAGGTLSMRGSQCVGFARYVYTALFYPYVRYAPDKHLAYDSTSTWGYTNMIYEVFDMPSLPAGYTAAKLKTLITACRPGAVLRYGDQHSLMIMAIYDDGFLTYDANGNSNYNQVDVRKYTWQSFVDSRGGYTLNTVHMPTVYPEPAAGTEYSYSTGDNTYYEVDVSSAGTYAVYNCTRVNVRTAPSVYGSSVVTELPAGTQIDVIGSYYAAGYDWMQVIYGGKACWIRGDYLKPVNTSAYVTFEASNGTVSYVSGFYTIGETFGDLPQAFSYTENRTLLGWLDYNDNFYTADSTVPDVEALALRAKWGVLTFTDVTEDDWFAPYVEQACSRGLLTAGTGFYPYSDATRAQMITVLGREYEAETGQLINNDGYTAFIDVLQSDYFAKYVAWASDAGICNGTGDYTFSPLASVTREQLAQFLYRLALYTGRTAPQAVDEVLLSGFADQYMIHDYAKEAICWAVNMGILQGTAEGYINPQSNASRAEMVVMMSRYVSNVSAANSMAYARYYYAAPPEEAAEVLPEPEVQEPAEAAAEQETPEEPDTAEPVGAEPAAEAAEEAIADIPPAG